MRNTDLTIVHASTPVMPQTALIAWTGATPSDVIRAQEKHAQNVLDDAARLADEMAGGVLVRTMTLVGAPVTALIELSARAELMVTGRRGMSSLPRVFLGSVSTALVHHGQCDVAVIHDEFSIEAGREYPVVLGIDGSPASERATAIAFNESSWRGVELVVIHAAYDSDPFGIHELEWAVAKPKAMEVLAERLAGWQERYPDVPVRRVLAFDRPARHLIEAGETAQLVVVGSRGHGEIAGRLLGSVSGAVVQATRAPVIVGRPA